MASFTFQTDREHIVRSPITLYPSVDLKGDAITLAAGDKVIYRGVVIIDNVIRYTFCLPDGKKAFTQDRAQLENGLEENFDALSQMSYGGLVEA